MNTSTKILCIFLLLGYSFLQAQTQITIGNGSTATITATAGTDDHITITNNDNQLIITNTVPDFIVNGVTTVPGNSIALLLSEYTDIDQLVIDGGNELMNRLDINVNHNFGTTNITATNFQIIEQLGGDLQTTTGNIDVTGRSGIIIRGNVQTTSGNIKLFGNEPVHNILENFREGNSFSTGFAGVQFGYNGVFINNSATITTISGAIDILGGTPTEAIGEDLNGVHLLGTISSTGSGVVGDITLSGRGGFFGTINGLTGTNGIFMNSASINAVDASISISGLGGSDEGSAAHGVEINTTGIFVTGSGNITINGTSGPRFNLSPNVPDPFRFVNHAVILNNASINGGGGDITITGALSQFTNRGSRVGGVGVFIRSNTNIDNLNAGNITVTGIGHLASPRSIDEVLIQDESNEGISMLLGTQSISTEDGNITFTGHQSNSPGSRAIYRRVTPLGNTFRSTGSGNITFNAFSNTNTAISGIPVASMSLFFNNDDFGSASGDINVNGFDFNGAPGFISFIAGADNSVSAGRDININATTIEIVTRLVAGRNVNIVCDTIRGFNTLEGLSNLMAGEEVRIRPKTAGSRLGLGDGAVGDLVLDAQLLGGLLFSPDNKIVFGDATTGDIDMQPHTYLSDVEAIGANITVNNVNVGTNTLTLNSSTGNTIQESDPTALSTFASNLIVEGTLSPGGIDTRGSFIALGDVTFSANDTFVVDIMNAGGLDELVVAGSPTLTLNNATLLATTTLFTPTAGEVITIIDVAGTNPVVGTFNGLDEGALIDVDGEIFQISYVGGDGNDITLTNDNTLSTVDSELLNFSVFPNPAQNEITLQNVGNLNLERLELYDLTGRLIRSINIENTASDVTINISGLNTATYLMNIVSDQGNVVRKLVKN